MNYVYYKLTISIVVSQTSVGGITIFEVTFLQIFSYFTNTLLDFRWCRLRKGQCPFDTSHYGKKN